MRRFFVVIILALAACAVPSAVVVQTPDLAADGFEPQTLTVFAAASLTNAFGEIGQNFEAANPGVKVRFNFGGSQTLRTQIEQGADADLFAPANKKELDVLIEAKMVLTDSVQTFLTNQMVVVMPASNPAGLTELADLALPGLKLVLAAKEVPAGNYALQVLDSLDANLGDGFKDRVLANVVSYENDVKQVVAKIQLGEADAALVYVSDTAASPDLKMIEIPAENNVIAQYPLAVLTQTRYPALARAFAAYVLSPEGQSVLANWGFLPVK